MDYSTTSDSDDNEGRTYLHVPFNEKDIVKNLGAKWSQYRKQWYADEMATALKPYRIIYLYVPFEYKDDAKMKGC